MGLTSQGDLTAHYIGQHYVGVIVLNMWVSNRKAGCLKTWSAMFDHVFGCYSLKAKCMFFLLCFVHIYKRNIDHKNRGNKEIPLAILSRILAQSRVTPLQAKGYA